jgi:2-C-methyl-D-erythritol 4-phosphate cytidylyltransferase
MIEKYVIITAGGKGVRMNAQLPKQFLKIAGKPIIIHTLQAFLHYNPLIRIILVLPHDQIHLWKELALKHQLDIPVEIVSGGPTRFHSVKNGLSKVSNDSLVGIHDGVRPLVSNKTIANAFEMAEKLGNGIPTCKINESVRITDYAINKPIDRDTLRLIQTPQCFRSSLIKKAYEANYDESFTDDASVLEKTGARIYLSEGNRENIKITTPEDLIIANALLQQ